MLAAAAAPAASQTKASLKLDLAAARPGDTVMAALRLEMKDGWHTYWRNGGDAGAPTEIQWQLPPGLSAGALQWPAPEKYEAEGVYSYVYHDEVWLLTPLRVQEGTPLGTAALKAKVSWLECEKLCLPGAATVTATLEIAPEARPSADAPALAEWRRKVPPPAPFPVRAAWEPVKGAERPLIIEWQPGEGFKNPDFFPYADAGYEVGHPTEVLAGAGKDFKLRKTVKASAGQWPAKVSGLLVAETSDGRAAAWEAHLEPGGGAPAAAAAAPDAAGNAAGVTKLTLGLLLLKLGAAFLGGLILNVMPCVLPVIALKILGFVHQSHADPWRVRKMGLVYAGGVLASFVALALVVIAVKAAGRAASWGLQYQSTPFVVVMTLLVLLVALNLFGVFEITLGGGVMTAAGALARREGLGGAFFHGVLATALATPCTAPFLGAALGFAIPQKAPVILLFFLTIGLGLAAPYVLLSWHPAWLRFVPKPGPWMERFKKAMGFPMLATAVWLFAQGVEGLGAGSELWLGLFLVLMALAVWIYGEFVQRASRGRAGGWLAIGALVAGAYLFILEGRLRWRSPPPTVATAGIIQTHPGGIEWRAWSPEAVQEARAQGRPVLVDFTASWCLTCQVNAKTSLEIPSVKQKLKEINAVALLENSRRKNAQVVAELNRHGRAGVPLVLVYPKDPAKPPEVLPEILTPSLVLDALARAAK